MTFTAPFGAFPMMWKKGSTTYYETLASLAKAEMGESQLKPNYQLLMESAAAQNMGEE